MEIFKRAHRKVARLFNRNRNRTIIWMDATLTLQKHYEDMGDTKPVAKDKVDEITDDLYENNHSAIDGFIYGVTRQKTKLITAVNNVNEVAFPHFNTAAKLIVTDKINQVT